MTVRRAIVAAALLLSACSPVAPEDEREYRVELGRLTYPGSEADVQVPAVVQAGQPFTVRVASYGSTCRRPAPAQVSTTGMRTDVEVYVRELVRGVCNRALGRMEHEVQLVFPQRGTAVVAFHGTGEGDTAGDGPAVIEVVIERTVTVQ